MIEVTKAEPNTGDWLNARREGIGASEISVLLGENPWATPHDLWETKLGIHETEVSEAMLMGHRLEEAILDEYRERFGQTVKTWREGLPSTIALDEYPIIRASLDGLDQDGCPVEIKATSSRSWDEVPRQYVCQARWQAGILGAPYTTIFVLHASTKCLAYKVQADPTWFEAAVGVAVHWWGRHILGGEEPPFTEPKKPAPSVEGLTAEVDRGLFEKYVELRQVEREAKSARQDAESLLKAQVADADTILVDGEKRGTWRTGKPRESVDLELLEKGFPEVYSRVLRERPGPRYWRVK